VTGPDGVAGAPADDRPRLILVVDDEDLIRRLLRVVLETDEFDVVEAADGEMALGLVDAERPAVVVLDVMMPGLDGVEVCRRLPHDRVKVVMLTARDDPRLERRCRDAGADAFVKKPFSSVDLLDLVAGLVSGDR
jgi:DNA-binding response OmpR family regulator